MRSSRHALFLCAVLSAACSSKVTQTLDTDLQNKVNTVTDCLPPNLAVLDELIEFADLWRLNGGTNPPDPSGLVWAEQGNGTINYTITVTGFTITGVISFYSPVGALQNLTLSNTSLSLAIDEAATEMRNLFGASDPFMVGTWQINDTGGAVETGSGAFTAIIGGSTNQNELESISTTTSTPAGGPPSNANGSITIDGCTLTFNTTSLVTDATPSQEYPIGTINFTLAGPSTTVTAALVFDATVTARLTVTGITGRFDINLETLSVTFVP